MSDRVKKTLFLLPAIIVSFVASFMVFLYEPITLYANNVDDFWFDFYTLIGPSLLFFFLSFLALAVVLIVVAVISKNKKHLNLYYIVISIFSLLLICSYIHSNFLANFLPPLDGTSFNWSDPTANIVSIVVCVILIGLLIFSIVKIKPQKTSKYCTYINSAIFAMLLVSLLSTIATTDVLKPKEFTPIATTKNLNLVSNNNNYLILLVDAVDSTHFNKIVSSNKDYQRIFKDFSYFPDTLSGYAFTRDSIPFIFSGEWNENQTSFSEYSTNAFNNSKFFAKLAEKEYNRNFYNFDFVWDDTKSLEFDNIMPLEKNIQKKTLLKQDVKFFLYKALPFPLKSLSKIETLDFSSTLAPQKEENFVWYDHNFYNYYLEQPLSKTDQNYFQYIHIEGAHVPFNLDSNVALLPDTEEGTYEDKVESTIKIIDKYLSRLKESEAYNNSTIIILADHGFWYEETNRANPILYIKGKSEKHDKMVVSDKQISYADLCNGFIELLDNKSSTEIFKDIPTEGRIRRYLYNGFNEEEHMYEYEQAGHAWEADKLKPTGREFDL